MFKSNFEKYNDPEQYDLEYQNYLNDVPFLAEWANKQKGTVVDLGCGTGRATIPLAQKGYKLIGVDLHEGMLNHARGKTMNDSLSVEWILQDCTKLSLNVLVSLMYMTGNSFQHFLTNESQNQLLQSVHNHLEVNGVFIFNTRFPILNELAEVDESTRIYQDQRNRKIREKTKETYHPLTQILHCTSSREILDGPGKGSIEQDSISLRYVFPLEMVRLLTQNGFSILKTYSSWKKEPLKTSSSEMIFVCIKN
ncbi:class I SAM-dependent methyltransferase [Planococcus halotolerans]|uniref:Class I SAM-dependent methyltransferase n=1 Tax=Planococcus halotolerans TaxID=2233542 RepID=A0A365L3U4_9BACL|nr:class I SAM-dependent methyltransferase [Planococcus halotolerans]